MGSIEDLWHNSRTGAPTDRYGRGKRYRAVPWLAGAAGARGRRGPSATFDTFREAEFHNARVERGDDADAAAAGAPVARNRRRVLFAEYVTEVAATMGEARATRLSYMYQARGLAREWPTQTLDEITPDMVDAYFARLVDEQASRSKRAKRRTVLVETYRRAVRSELVRVNPTADVKPISQRSVRKKRPVSEDEFAWTVEETPAWLRPALYLAYDSGLRSGEVCGLPWGNVDLDGARVFVGPVMQDNGTIKPLPKNDEPAEVPLTPRTVEVLRAARQRFPGNDADLVIREPRVGGRQPIDPRRYRHLFHRACRMAGLALPLPRPHDLRHGLTGRLVASGANIHVVQRIMRHRNLASTSVYFPPVSMDEMRAAQASMDVPEPPEDDLRGRSPLRAV